ncbi:MAG: universal stress protein [Planctomycetota bacterium]|nr:universal stress protein [Planctomycetota bacterium]
MQDDPSARSARVLACVDQSHFADTVADYAAWAARRLDAPLEFLHVIDREPEVASTHDHSGAIGIDSREELLGELSREDEARTRAARERGRIFLERLRQRASAAGCPSVDVRQRHGSLDETLVEQESDVQLFVLGRRGASAEITQRDLGRNLERMLRALRRPILTVTDAWQEPRRVLLALDGRRTTRKAVEFVARSPLFDGLPVHLFAAGAAEGDRSLAAAVDLLAKAGRSPAVVQATGDVERGVAAAIRETGSDLLVMGAYAHSWLRSLFVGSRTNGLLRASTVPTLLVR